MSPTETEVESRLNDLLENLAALRGMAVGAGTLTFAEAAENMAADRGHVTRIQQFIGLKRARQSAVGGVELPDDDIARIEYEYNGMPFLLVELWPSRGDRILVDGKDWHVEGGADEGEVNVSLGDEEHGSIRHSSTKDGLFFCEGGGERDGWELALLDKAKPRGQRQWTLRRGRTPSIVGVGVVQPARVEYVP